MKIIYENCGLKNYMKVDHRSYGRNFFQFKRTLDLLSQVYNEPIQRPAPIWLVSKIGKSAVPISQRSRVGILYKPECFFRLSFRNCKRCVYNCDDLLSYNS